jgi:hypothetical protein
MVQQPSERHHACGDRCIRLAVVQSGADERDVLQLIEVVGEPFEPFPVGDDDRRSR